MNPSAPDWIAKFLNRFDKNQLIGRFQNEAEFYSHLKDTGFIFGVSFKAIPSETLSHLKLTKEEFTKVNLFHALLFSFFQTYPNATYEEAVSKMIAFYAELEKGKTGFFRKFSLSNHPVNILENIISNRIQETNSLTKKSTVALLTNALLFIDVLVFSYWLKNKGSIKTNANEIEMMVLESCYFTMKAKRKKKKYDLFLIELFENSKLYLNEEKAENPSVSKEYRHFSEAETIEKKYILDLCCLIIREDKIMDESELLFLNELTAAFQLPAQELTQSINQLTGFSEKHTSKIQLFEYSHPVKQFYKQSSATVKLLILRNKNRLLTEISQSGELILLLGQSTTRDLTKAEKRKVKEQLLDICKTVPSLTIFLLPGGGILLPLLVKFIPKILPSAFQDNRIE